MLIFLTLFACTELPLSLQPPPRGQVSVCVGHAGGVQTGTGSDIDVEISGTVVGFESTADMDQPGCDTPPAITVDIEDENGEIWTVGWAFLDNDGADITPPVDLDLNAQVDLIFRWRMVWGTTAGFVLTDDSGLVVAADQGAWGSALSTADLPGFEVVRGDTIVALDDSSCQPIEGYTVDFITADDRISVYPVGTEEITVNGQALQVTALQATAWGESATCSVSDTTDVTAWAAQRPL